MFARIQDPSVFVLCLWFRIWFLSVFARWYFLASSRLPVWRRTRYVFQIWFLTLLRMFLRDGISWRVLIFQCGDELVRILDLVVEPFAYVFV